CFDLRCDKVQQSCGRKCSECRGSTVAPIRLAVQYCCAVAEALVDACYCYFGIVVSTTRFLFFEVQILKPLARSADSLENLTISAIGAFPGRIPSDFRRSSTPIEMLCKLLLTRFPSGGLLYMRPGPFAGYTCFLKRFKGGPQRRERKPVLNDPVFQSVQIINPLCDPQIRHREVATLSDLTKLELFLPYIVFRFVDPAPQAIQGPGHGNRVVVRGAHPFIPRHGISLTSQYSFPPVQFVD